MHGELPSSRHGCKAVHMNSSEVDWTARSEDDEVEAAHPVVAWGQGSWLTQRFASVAGFVRFVQRGDVMQGFEGAAAKAWRRLCSFLHQVVFRFYCFTGVYCADCRNIEMLKSDILPQADP